MTPTPDTKGAQPEQLVERLRIAAPFQNDPSNESLMLDAATALYECREALQNAPQPFDGREPYATEYSAWWKGQRRTTLAAQPPSEASERSGA